MPLLRKLRNLLVAEREADLTPHSGSYAVLLRLMKRYSDGTGPAPTVEQFQKWRDEVAQQLLDADSSGPDS